LIAQNINQLFLYDQRKVKAMKIQCNQCQTQYRIDESKIPERGAHVICKKCNEKIIIPSQIKNLKNKTDSLSRIENVLERIAVSLETIVNTINDHHNENDSELAGQISQPEPEKDSKIQINTDQRNEMIIHYLEKKSIQIRRLPEAQASDELINSFALYLGDNYDAIEKLYRTIKRTMQKGESFKLHIANEPQKSISAMCQFAYRLYQSAFLADYKYLKSPQFLITARSSSLPNVQNFFSGQWLERYILQKMIEVVDNFFNKHATHLKWSYLINPQIILPNEDDFELDILFEVEKHIYWVEAKTGDYQSYIDKYTKMSKILGVDNQHAFMVLTSIDENLCDSLSSMFSMNVCSLNSFMESFDHVLSQDIQNQH
jgi:predicted Zn finger-like uncharacterized protein